MKLFDTGYTYYGMEIDLEIIRTITEELFENYGEEWLCIYDTYIGNQNYIQIYSDIEGMEDNAVKFMCDVLKYDKRQIDEMDKIYLIEYRKYEDDVTFKHYRAFFNKVDTIISYFEKYINNEEIDVKYWFDVSDEFTE